MTNTEKALKQRQDEQYDEIAKEMYRLKYILNFKDIGVAERIVMASYMTTVDNVTIHEVFFVDFNHGVVLTYDIFGVGEGAPLVSVVSRPDLREQFKDSEGVYYRVVRGNVQLQRIP